MIEIMDTPTLKTRKLGFAVVAATIGILVFSGSAAQAKAQPTERPNIILFLVDDLGWQDTSLQLQEALHQYWSSLPVDVDVIAVPTVVMPPPQDESLKS